MEALIFGQEVQVCEQYDCVVGEVIWAKDFIGQAISSETPRRSGLGWGLPS